MGKNFQVSSWTPETLVFSQPGEVAGSRRHLPSSSSRPPPPSRPGAHRRRHSRGSSTAPALSSPQPCRPTRPTSTPSSPSASASSKPSRPSRRPRGRKSAARRSRKLLGRRKGWGRFLSHSMARGLPPFFAGNRLSRSILCTLCSLIIRCVV